MTASPMRVVSMIILALMARRGICVSCQREVSRRCRPGRPQGALSAIRLTLPSAVETANSFHGPFCLQNIFIVVVLCQMFS